MIYECAISPEFLVKLVEDKNLANMLLRHFKNRPSIVISGYSRQKKEAQATFEIFQQNLPEEMKNTIPLLKQQFTEIWSTLFGPNSLFCNRHQAEPWNNSFQDEHQRLYFNYILSDKEKATNNYPVYQSSCLFDIDCKFFNCPEHILVNRNANDICNTIKPILHNATEFTFVEPYFQPEDCFINGYKLFFEEIKSACHVRRLDNSYCTVTIICSDKALNNTTYKEQPKFIKECKTKLAAMTSNKFRLQIYRIAPKRDKQEIHNRYLLTNIGGILFGHGTDTSENPTTCDDLAILSLDSFRKLKQMYKYRSQEFDWNKNCVLNIPTKTSQSS